jgi:hypothetical protein
MATDRIFERGVTLVTDEAERFRSGLPVAPGPPGSEQEETRQKALVETAIKRFQLATTAEMEQRQREKEDLLFDRALPEDQWPAWVRTARAGGIGPDGFQVSERPCLVINKLDQPIQQVINEARNARVGVHIKPKGDGADNEGAKVRQGIYRAIEQDSRANVARLWALDRAVKCGRGCYRIEKVYANDGDFDIDLVIKRILNQGSVYLDPFAVEPDWSDGEWALITTDMPLAEYQRRYPDSNIADASADELMAIGDQVPGWIGGTDADGGRTIRVAEYFYVEHTERTLLFIEGLGKVFQDEYDGPIPPTAKRRKVDQRNVKWCVINANEVLEEQDWEGRFIPIVPVTGKEYNVDGDRTFKGVVSNSKDAQRSYNYMRSAQVEAVGLAPKAPYIMAEGQDEGYESMWDQLNTRNYTRLKYKPVDFNGQALPPPQRNVAEPAIQAISMAVNMADADIKSTTGRFDPSLGRARADQSGKAILALKESGESTTSNYLEQLTYVSMYYEAKISLDLMPYVYDRPGRILRILGEEPHEDRTVMLNQPFVPTPQGPQPAPSPTMLQRWGQAAGGMVGLKPPPEPQYYDLSKGQYSVEITVGKAFATQREENAEMLRAIIETAPGLTPMLADLLVEQIDTPIAKRAAERLRKLNPQIQDEEQEPIPPALKMQMDQLAQQNQQLTEALTQATQEIKAQRYKVDAEVQIAQMEVQSRERIAGLTAQTTMQTTMAKTQTTAQVAALQAKADLEEVVMEQTNERRMRAAEILAKRGEREDQQAHEVAMEAADDADERRARIEQQAHERHLARETAEAKVMGEALKDRRGQAFEREQGERQRQHERGERQADRVHEHLEQGEERRQERREGNLDRLVELREGQKAREEAEKDRQSAKKEQGE